MANMSMSRLQWVYPVTTTAATRISDDFKEKCLLQKTSHEHLKTRNIRTQIIAAGKIKTVGKYAEKSVFLLLRSDATCVLMQWKVKVLQQNPTHAVRDNIQHTDLNLPVNTALSISMSCSGNHTSEAFGSETRGELR